MDVPRRQHTCTRRILAPVVPSERNWPTVTARTRWGRSGPQLLALHAAASHPAKKRVDLAGRYAFRVVSRAEGISLLPTSCPFASQLLSVLLCTSPLGLTVIVNRRNAVRPCLSAFLR